MILRKIATLLQKYGYGSSNNVEEVPSDIVGDDSFVHLYEKVRPFTMTSVERLYSLYKATRYVLDNKIAGDFVECGVWKGGSAMMIAHVLNLYGEAQKKIFLYDTFAGMPPPDENDVDFQGRSASKLLASSKLSDDIWAYSTLSEVRVNLLGTGYPVDKILFIEGKVEDTIPNQIPEAISLLRLDTDWYESTRHELIHLYPLLTRKGVLIIDDYGYWKGSRKAVDEYFSQRDEIPLLGRIDETGRMLVK